jgi:hypothetical protein
MVPHRAPVFIVRLFVQPAADYCWSDENPAAKPAGPGDVHSLLPTIAAPPEAIEAFV